MCCFTAPVAFVSDTSIFARGEADGQQVLAYAMRVGTSRDLAMVLPLPVPAGSDEGAVTFIDLSGYTTFFEDLAQTFPLLQAPIIRNQRSGGVQYMSYPPLAVERVGLFDASFVPTIADFTRLDPRFQLPAGVWDALPDYRDWGFAVFKLHTTAPTGIRGLWSRVTGGRAHSQAFHPMALRFPRRDSSALFFPTLHIHDGAVHETARFSHHLYLQYDGDDIPAQSWLPSRGPLAPHVDVTRAGGLIVGDRPAFKRMITGEHANRDTYIAT